MSNVTSLNDREIARCPICRKSVLFGDNFVRQNDAAFHVLCLVGVRHARKVARAAGGAALPDTLA